MNQKQQEKIVIEDGVTDIEDGAYAGYNLATSAVIPESVSIIGTAAFKGCHELSDVVIPANVRVIRGRAFYGCDALTDVIIPECIAVMGSYAFDACHRLKSVVVKAKTPPEIGEKIFDVTVPGFKIRVPDESVDDYRALWKEYAAYIAAY